MLLVKLRSVDFAQFEPFRCSPVSAPGIPLVDTVTMCSKNPWFSFFFIQSHVPKTGNEKSDGTCLDI
jgi:hypothetical protein